jgi:hypothetical protein
LFLTPALNVGEWSASRLCRLTPSTHCIEGWVGYRCGLNALQETEVPSEETEASRECCPRVANEGTCGPTEVKFLETLSVRVGLTSICVAYNVLPRMLAKWPLHRLKM